MLTKVIVGIDGHDAAAALAFARSVAPDDAIVLVHAYPFETAAARAVSLGYGAGLRADAATYMASTAADAGLDPSCTELVADTSPARALQHAAERHRADLIVVGSAHHGRAGRLLLGDVSRGVLHDAPCPVGVAPRGFERRAISAIGVGFDGSPESEEALRFAASLGVPLQILSAVDIAMPAWSEKSYVPDIERIEEGIRSDAQKRLEDAMSALRVPAEAHAVFGAAATQLKALAAEVDLVVVGSRGWGPVRRTLMGSTSDRLIHEAPCPVVVVPRAAAQHDQPALRAAHSVPA